jgi:hypothetical protein
MNELISNFLASRFPISGLAAYSIHIPTRMLEAQCLSKSLYPTSTEAMLNQVVLGGRALLPCGESPAQYCWTFEAHRVYVASRPDGFSLALLVENNPKTQLVRVKETLQGFLDLTEI